MPDGCFLLSAAAGQQVLNGALDPRCPREGVELAAAAARQEYARHGAESAFEVHFAEGVAHATPPDMLRRARSFLHDALHEGDGGDRG